MGKFFITSTGTGVGKTYVMCSLIKYCAAHNMPVNAIKPVISGWEDYNDEIDSCKILSALDRSIFPDDIEIVSPWRFTAPLSPDMAAKQEGREINFEKLLEFCRFNIDNSENLFIEGVGGVMVPINHEKTFLDLMEALKIPAILVVGSYLGTISHTLTAINSLNSRNIKIHEIIINESEEGVDLEDTKISISNFTDVPIKILKRNSKICKL